jgi:hypothetical protein
MSSHRSGEKGSLENQSGMLGHNCGRKNAGAIAAREHLALNCGVKKVTGKLRTK